MINVIICDDNAVITKNISRIISNYLFKRKQEFKIHVFDDYNAEFMKLMNSNLQCKIYILDIETPSRSGIDIARIIRETDLNSIIIFITGHEELGGTILRNDLLFLSFINKFDDYENRLINSIKKSLSIFNKINNLKFKEGSTVYTIAMNDIIYITRDSLERKCIIKTDYTEFRTYKTFKELETILDERFIRVHRACIVNKDRITKIDYAKRIIEFNNGQAIDLLSTKYIKGVTL